MLRLSRCAFSTTSTLRSTSFLRPGRFGAWKLSRQWHETGARHFVPSVSPRQQQLADNESPSFIPPSLESNVDHGSDFARTLPVVCPGCGAFSQTVEPEEPGFYSPKTRNVSRSKKQSEDDIYRQALARLSTKDGSEVALPDASAVDTSNQQMPSICDRCHDLLYQSKGNSILHPSMQSIQAIIESSPHKRNHIYHVLDAADFPMSLIPNLMSSLQLPRLRTQNRRSKSTSFARGRVAEVSFIITRSDLLAPQKEQVDRMMPYLQEVLRDALGRTNKNARLGNVRCVSAKRGWWTPKVKQEIWERGGAGWVVGKVNVGKSALFEVVFPKGRGHGPAEDAKLKAVREAGSAPQGISSTITAEHDPEHADTLASQPGDSDDIDSALRQDREDTVKFSPNMGEVSEEYDFDEQVAVDEAEEDSLLPPLQPEAQYPRMPVVSSLPGTTASPIRIPFGNGKGELIDLPGVQRSSLETHVLPEHHSSLVMKSRVVPDQHTLKPGQSLLLGGIIRITPKTEDLIVLACPFTPLEAHATSTQKAMAIQTGRHDDGTPYTGNVENIGTDTAKGRVRSAGTFKLNWDVTKKRTGPVTDKTAGKQKAENLPFIVYGADILIEGVGWVELVCQVRKRRQRPVTDALSAEFDDAGTGSDVKHSEPEVEVFTPKGKFIGVRRPMNAWLTSGPKKIPKHAQRQRPRMTISMHRRKEGGKSGQRKVTTELT